MAGTTVPVLTLPLSPWWTLGSLWWTACTASLVTDTHTPLVDISSLESTTGSPELTLATHPKSGQIVLLEMSHRFHLDHLSSVMDVALAGCRDISAILDTVVRKHVANTGAQLGWEHKK